MAAGAVYATATELGAFIASVNNESSIDVTHRQVELTSACTAASRSVDQHCGRPFWDAESATARTYAASDCGLIDVADFSTTTGLVVKTDTSGDGTYETTWASTDYQVEPADGVWNGDTGWPFWKLRAIQSRTFPTSKQRLVEVTAQWGWAAVPGPVTQATLILAHRLYRRAETPEGVAGFGEFGVVRLGQRDTDVASLLAPYRRHAMLTT